MASRPFLFLYREAVGEVDGTLICHRFLFLRRHRTLRSCRTCSHGCNRRVWHVCRCSLRLHRRHLCSETARPAWTAPRSKWRSSFLGAKISIVGHLYLRLPSQCRRVESWRYVTCRGMNDHYAMQMFLSTRRAFSLSYTCGSLLKGFSTRSYPPSWGRNRLIFGA